MKNEGDSGSDPAPVSIPEHELLRRIGRGSYGEVWLARSRLGALRAVKIVRRKDFDEERPYEREFAGIQKFEPISRSHEGFVNLLQVGRNDAEGYFYYVMELADRVPSQEGELSGPKGIQTPAIGAEAGVEQRRTSSLAPSPVFDLRNSDLYQPRTLAVEVKPRGALKLDECLWIARSLARALSELHRHGLVHRDIKPSNIIFVGGVPKLADIGLVAGVNEARSFVGTEGFIPPEGPGTPRADIYSLGIVLYVISTGKSHPDFPEPAADLASRPDRERWLELQAIIHRACQADPRQRYANAEAMLAELNALERGQSVMRKRLILRSWRVALVLAVLGLFATASVVLKRHLIRSENLSDGPPSRFDAANILCDRAIRIIRSDDYERFDLARTNLYKAMELDPQFALPYVGLMELRLRKGKDKEGMPPIQELSALLHQLEELGPHLAATHCLRSIVRFRNYDYVQARDEARKAIATDPNYQFAHTAYGWILVFWDPTQARAQFEESRRLNRSKTTSEECFIDWTYYAERKYQQSINGFLETLKSNPKVAMALESLENNYLAIGDYTNAINYRQQFLVVHGGTEAEAKEDCDELRDAYAKDGEQGYWAVKLRRCENNPNGERYWKAICYWELGNKNAALRLLNEAIEITRKPGGPQAESLLHLLGLHHFWDPLRDDPEFIALLDKIGLSKVMPRK